VYVEALSRPYVRADNRTLLGAVNDSLLREFLKLLSQLKLSPSPTVDISMPAANISMAVTDVSLLSDGSSMLVLSQILSSYSHELSCLLSGRGHSESDNLRDKLLTSLPHVADVCRHLVHSDSVSLCHPAVTQRNRLTLTWKM